MSKLTKCSRPDGETCLMWKDGFCRGLAVTKECAFYKDRRTMRDYEIIEYEEELYLDGYKGATPEQVDKSIKRWRDNNDAG